MSAVIDIRELSERIDEILSLAAAGREIVLVDGDTPRARIVPWSGQPRTPGLSPGAIVAESTFDDPLPDDFWIGKP